MLLISSFLQNLRRFSFLADRFKYPATTFRPDFCERPGREYDFPAGVWRQGVCGARAKASKSRSRRGSGLVRQIKACRRTHARQYAREKASVVEKCVRAVSTRMERPEQYGLRTMKLRNELTEAIEDPNGVKAMVLFPAATSLQEVRARCEHADGTGTTER